MRRMKLDPKEAEQLADEYYTDACYGFAYENGLQGGQKYELKEEEFREMLAQFRSSPRRSAAVQRFNRLVFTHTLPLWLRLKAHFLTLLASSYSPHNTSKAASASASASASSSSASLAAATSFTKKEEEGEQLMAVSLLLRFLGRWGSLLPLPRYFIYFANKRAGQPERPLAYLNKSHRKLELRLQEEGLLLLQELLDSNDGRSMGWLQVEGVSHAVREAMVELVALHVPALQWHMIGLPTNANENEGEGEGESRGGGRARRAGGGDPRNSLWHKILNFAFQPPDWCLRARSSSAYSEKEKEKERERGEARVSARDSLLVARASLLAKLMDFFPEDLVQAMERLMDEFGPFVQKALCPSSGLLGRCYAVILVNDALKYLPTQPALHEGVFEEMLQVLMKLCEEGKFSMLNKALHSFTGIPLGFVKRHLMQYTNVMLSIGCSTAIPSPTRIYAVENLYTLVEENARVLRKYPQFIRVLLKALMGFLLETQYDTTWNEYDEEGCKVELETNRDLESATQSNPLGKEKEIENEKKKRKTKENKVESLQNDEARALSSKRLRSRLRKEKHVKKKEEEDGEAGEEEEVKEEQEYDDDKEEDEVETQEEEEEEEQEESDFIVEEEDTKPPSELKKDREQTIDFCAGWMLSDLALHFKGKVTYGVCIKVVDMFLSCHPTIQSMDKEKQEIENDNSWRYRYAALMTLFTIIEGCSQEIGSKKDEVLRLTDVVVSHFNDPHPLVRYAACNCVSQLSAHFNSTAGKTKCHKVLLAGLLKALSDYNNPRLQERACQALVDVFDSDTLVDLLGSKMESADELFPLFDVLFKQLRTLIITTNRKRMKEKAITAVSAVACAVHERFSPYYEYFAPPCAKILKDNRHQTPADMALRARALECITSMGRCIKAERFEEDAVFVASFLLSAEGEEFAKSAPGYIGAALTSLCMALHRPSLSSSPLFYKLLEQLLEILSPTGMETHSPLLDRDEETNNEVQHEMKTQALKALPNLLIHFNKVEGGPETLYPYLTRFLRVLRQALGYNADEDDIMFSIAQSFPQLLSIAKKANAAMEKDNLVGKREEQIGDVQPQKENKKRKREDSAEKQEQETHQKEMDTEKEENDEAFTRLAPQVVGFNVIGNIRISFPQQDLPPNPTLKQLIQNVWPIFLGHSSRCSEHLFDCMADCLRVTDEATLGEELVFGTMFCLGRNVEQSYNRLQNIVLAVEGADEETQAEVEEEVNMELELHGSIEWVFTELVKRNHNVEPKLLVSIISPIVQRLTTLALDTRSQCFQRCADRTITAGVCMMDDILEYCPLANDTFLRSHCLETFLPVLCQHSSSASASARLLQAAVYGLGITAQVITSPVACSSSSSSSSSASSASPNNLAEDKCEDDEEAKGRYALQVIEQLPCLMERIEKERDKEHESTMIFAIDNTISAVGKMAYHLCFEMQKQRREDLLVAALEVFLKHLPLRVDETEMVTVCNLLCDFVESGEDSLRWNALCGGGKDKERKAQVIHKVKSLLERELALLEKDQLSKEAAEHLQKYKFFSCLERLGRYDHH